MAVTIIDRPYSLIKGSEVTSNIYRIDNPLIAGSGTHAVVLEISHNLNDYDRVYIHSSIEDYNGFWYVKRTSANVFAICSNIDLTSLVTYIKDADISYYQCTGKASNWNCIHLPIIYKISSNLWPTNSADTGRTISSVTDSNGYCAIVASADIKATGSAAALEFIKITGATDDNLNGVWQITSYTNDTTFTLEIPYSSANDTALTGASIQYYYNNYHVKVQVWGGLENSHAYYAQEPYELLATLSLVPDEDGICQFSIHEILKKNIAIKNNLLLGTLPNNLDAFTKFFIKYCEVYDDSDGTTLSTLAESYTSDMIQFEGVAVNAVLPFKNVYSGALSQYISGDSSQKFLTAWVRPTIFEGQYFDLSLLWDGIQDIFYKLEWYLNDVLQATTYSDFFDAFYTGVYRGEITANCDYDRVDVTAYKTVGTIPPSAWTNDTGSFDTKSTTQFIETASAASEMTSAYTPAVLQIGEARILEVTVTITGTWTGEIIVQVYLANGALLRSNVNEVDTTVNGTFTLDTPLTVVTSATTRLYVFMSEFMTSGSATVTINIPTYGGITQSAYVISETKTLDINCDCVPSKATGFYLAWLNYLGGFDHWYFTQYSDHIIDITDSGETEENIFPEWPASFGEFADTIRKQTFRKSRRQVVIRSQNLTLAQLQAIEYIKTSPLVQIVNSIYDRRTVIVDTDSFTSYREGQKELYTITFTITYTDDVPSQTV